ncbi:MAG: GNAT family N-acetyltransferase, partial [Clostridia bacterium]|nr:GNAT family N-acetyltransferase [Clostridia bacterium]
MDMIRLMQNKDKDEYFEMSRAFYSSGAALEEIPEEWRKSFWQEIMLGQYIKGYIVESAGEVAGYALAFIFASQEAGGKVMFIDELFVKKKFRGKGLGKEFFAFAEKTDGIAA